MAKVRLVQSPSLDLAFEAKLGLVKILKGKKLNIKFKYEQEEIHLKGAKGVKHIPNSLW